MYWLVTFYSKPIPGIWHYPPLPIVTIYINKFHLSIRYFYNSRLLLWHQLLLLSKQEVVLLNSGKTCSSLSFPKYDFVLFWNSSEHCSATLINLVHSIRPGNVVIVENGNKEKEDLLSGHHLSQTWTSTWNRYMWYSFVVLLSQSSSLSRVYQSNIRRPRLGRKFFILWFPHLLLSKVALIGRNSILRNITNEIFQCFQLYFSSILSMFWFVSHFKAV